MLSFITLLKDHPAIGFLIGLVIFAILFSVKNLVVYLYSRHHEKERARAAHEAMAKEGNQMRKTDR